MSLWLWRLGESAAAVVSLKRAVLLRGERGSVAWRSGFAAAVKAKGGFAVLKKIAAKRTKIAIFELGA